jgi:hypothetical protein
MACVSNGYWDCSDGQGGGGGLTPAEKKDLNEVSETTAKPVASDFANGVIICKFEDNLYVKDSNGNVQLVGISDVAKVNHKPVLSDFDDEVKIVQYRNNLFVKTSNSVTPILSTEFIGRYKTKNDLPSNKFKNSIAFVYLDDDMRNNGVYQYNGTQWNKLYEVAEFESKRTVLKWLPETPYLQNDFVIHNGKLWSCWSGNTNSEPKEGNKDWIFISTFDNLFGSFANKNDLDNANGAKYTGQLAFVRNDDNPNNNGVYIREGGAWNQKLTTASIEYENLVAEYNPNIQYQSGDMCYYNRFVYVAKQDTKGNTPPNATYWDMLEIEGKHATIKFSPSSEIQKFYNGAGSQTFRLLGNDSITVELDIPDGYEIASATANGGWVAKLNGRRSVVLEANWLKAMGDTELTVTTRVIPKDISYALVPYGKSGTWYLLSNGYETFDSSVDFNYISYVTHSGNNNRIPVAKEGIHYSSYKVNRSNYMHLSDSITISQSHSFFISFWVKSYDLGDSRYMVGDNNTGGTANALHIGWRNTSTFTLALYANDVDWGGQDLNAYQGKWTHYALTYRYRGNNQAMARLYINGVNKGTRTYPKTDNYVGGGITMFGGARNGGNKCSGAYSCIRVAVIGSDTWIMYDNDIRRLYDEESKLLNVL